MQNRRRTVRPWTIESRFLTVDSIHGTAPLTTGLLRGRTSSTSGHNNTKTMLKYNQQKIAIYAQEHPQAHHQHTSATYYITSTPASLSAAMPFSYEGLSPCVPGPLPGLATAITGTPVFCASIIICHSGAVQNFPRNCASQYTTVVVLWMVERREVLFCRVHQSQRVRKLDNNNIGVWARKALLIHPHRWTAYYSQPIS